MVDGSGRSADAEARAADDSTSVRARLALFAKSPVAGAVKTRLVPPLDGEQAAALAAAFAADVVRTIERVPGIEPWLFVPRGELETAAALAPRWHVAEQAAGNLGERIADALARLGDARLPSVVIGADHPDLPPDRIGRALEALARADLCFGPTADGGFYLVAARAEQAEPESLGDLFAGIEWSSPRTLAMILDRARARNISVARIEPWPDVDTLDDLRALVARLAHAPASAPATRAALLRIGTIPRSP